MDLTQKFSVFLAGSDLEPACGACSQLIVDPLAKPEIGELAFVSLSASLEPARSIVGRLVGRSATSVTLEQITLSAQLSF